MYIIYIPIAILFAIIVIKITTSIDSKKKNVKLLRALVIFIFLLIYAAIVCLLPSAKTM
jgi:hypothetical protein